MDEIGEDRVCTRGQKGKDGVTVDGKTKAKDEMKCGKENEVGDVG